MGLGLDDESMDIIALADGTVMQTHGRRQCLDSPCPIHHPSVHPLSTAPLHWLPETGLMYRWCEHDSLHPDPDSLLYIRNRGFMDMGWHQCCPGLCCTSLLDI